MIESEWIMIWKQIYRLKRNRNLKIKAKRRCRKYRRTRTPSCTRSSSTTSRTSNPGPSSTSLSSSSAPCSTPSNSTSWYFSINPDPSRNHCFSFSPLFHYLHSWNLLPCFGRNCRRRQFMRLQCEQHFCVFAATDWSSGRDLRRDHASVLRTVPMVRLGRQVPSRGHDRPHTLRSHRLPSQFSLLPILRQLHLHLNVLELHRIVRLRIQTSPWHQYQPLCSRLSRIPTQIHDLAHHWIVLCFQWS